VKRGVEAKLDMEREDGYGSELENRRIKTGRGKKMRITALER
jgi:hypothetical protein